MKISKKILSILLSVIMVLGVCAVAPVTVSAADDGIVWKDAEQRYEISNYEGLKKFAAIINGEAASGDELYIPSFRQSACAVLMTDIDAGASASANDWIPIGKNPDNGYLGTFDGCGHSITGLTLNYSDQEYAGLFGWIANGGTVKNVRLESVNITGKSWVGGLAGYSRGIVLNCCSSGFITGNNHVGGLIGHNYSIVKNCYNTGSVSGDDQIGGVVGYNYGTVTNCYNTGDVPGWSLTGGIVGSSFGTILNCYNTGVISGNNQPGGIVGSSNGTIANCYNTGLVSGNYQQSGIVGTSSGTIKNCHYDKNVCGEIGAVRGADTETAIGLTTAQMTGSNALDYMAFEYNEDEENPWLVRESDEFYSYYPHLKGFDLDDSGAQIPAENIPKSDWPARLSKDGVMEISNYDELKAFASDVNSGNTGLKGILIKDIDASASASANDWTPIGNWIDVFNQNRYAGIFDGDGHTITGLTFNKPEQNYAGLFGLVGSDGKVQNIGLEGGNITGQKFVGGVAGANNGKISNCYNTGSVSGVDSAVGGVAGSNYGAVTNCYNTGSVSGRSNAGGVVGYIFNEGEVTNCYSSGTVSGEVYIGGVVGNNYGTVKSCWFDSSICPGLNGLGRGTNAIAVGGLSTAWMTGTNAIDNMMFKYEEGETNPWLVNETDSDYSYYPHLKGFVYDAEPMVENWPPKIENSNITVSASPSVGGNVSGDGTYTHGSQATVTATPNTGYHFVNWTENDEEASTDAEYEFEVESSRNLVANFAKDTFTITFVDENGKTVDTREYDVETTIIDEPAVPEKAGYTGKWEEYTLKIGGITVKPVYTEFEPAVAIDDYEENTTIGYKDNMLFRATAVDIPKDGSIHWFVNGENVGTGEGLGVEEPTENYTVQAKIIDKDGNVRAESGVMNVEVKSTFFDRLIAFFADLIDKILSGAIGEIFSSIC